MAEYSKAEKLQALEFLVNYIETNAGAREINNRLLSSVIGEQDAVYNNLLDDVPNVLQNVVNIENNQELTSQSKNKLLANIGEQLEKDFLSVEGDQRVKANYLKSSESHHPLELAGQYVASGELSMPEAIEYHQMASLAGYPQGTPVADMLSMRKDTHLNLAHMNPRTGKSKTGGSSNTYELAVNQPLRDIRSFDSQQGSTNNPYGNGRAGAGMALALATPHLERELAVSKAAYNSPVETAIREKLAERLGITTEELTSTEITPKRNREKRDISKAQRYKKDITNEMMGEVLDEVLNNPTIQSKQDALLEELVYDMKPSAKTIFDQKRKDNNPDLEMIIGVKGVNNEAFEGNEDKIMDYLTKPLDEIEDKGTINKNVRFESKRQIQNERIKRQEQKIISNLVGSSTNRVINHPQDIEDESLHARLNLNSRPRPDTIHTMKRLVNNIPGLDSLIGRYYNKRAIR